MSGSAEERHNQHGTETTAQQSTPPQEPQEAAGTDQQRDVEEAAEAVAHDLEELQRKARERDEFLQMLQRTRADYLNYQKRVARQLEEERKFAVQPFARDLLNVLDNLERAIEAAEKVAGAEAIVQGVRMVYQELLSVFERHGIRPIDSDNQVFDPAYHEAVAQEEREDLPPGRVVRTLQRGYMFHDRLLRPAKVVVSKEPEATQTAAERGGAEQRSDGPTDNQPA